MIPASFEYRRAGSAAEALALLAEHGDDAKILAGGHSLLPLMKLRLASPSLLVDVGRIPELAYIDDRGDQVVVGALTRHCDVQRSALLQAEVPLLAHVAGVVGDPQVRHRGTIGGSIAHGDPASDLPAAVLALGATLVISGPAGVREVRAEEFFRGFLETAIGPDELLTEIRLSKMGGAGWSYQKFNLRAQDWAIVGVAAVGAQAGGGIALVNMATTPVRASTVEKAVAAGASAGDAANFSSAGLDPPSDLNASAAFRRHLAGVLVRRALQEVEARTRS
ncbi:MAG TPA: xanthine dehydrogenase family protein subunit M [Acidimicrobiales bacterium]|nr:xanthine dehydrogenase family protein subunit M [Acidimicrobiales bacterium]